MDRPDLPALIGCGAGVLVFLVVLAVGLAIGLFVCYQLYQAASRLPAQYRKLAPGSIFLLLVPLLNFVWVFFVVIKLSESFKEYFAAQQRTDVGDCGYAVGLGWAITMVCGLIPVIGMLSCLASLVFMILFLVKMSQLKALVGTDLAPLPPMPPPIPGA
ncbi:MAG TPA: hypothetical protein VGK32_20035 [Vicinamibacterales bacterium]|jgi:hypothetical protein